MPMKTTNKQLYCKTYHITARMKKAPMRRIVVQRDRILQFIYQIPDLVLIISLIFNGIRFVYSADTTGTVDMHTANVPFVIHMPQIVFNINTLIHKYLPHSKMNKQSNKI